jgi:hypothetical protein
VLLGIGATAGLALGNHLLTAMLLPALALALVSAHPKALTAPKKLAALIAGGLAGLSVYAYLPLRARQAPALNYGKPVDWESFRALVLAERVRPGDALLSAQGLQTFGLKLGRIMELYGPWFSPSGAWAVLALGALGAAWLLWKDRWLLVGLLLAALPTLYVAALYPNGGASRYFFVPTAVALLLAAIGLQALVSQLSGALKAAGWPRLAQAATGLISLVAVLAPCWLGWANWQFADRSGDHASERLVDQVLADVPAHAAIAAEWNEVTSLWYAHHVAGVRPDVDAFYESNATEARWDSLEAGVSARLGQRPVYALLGPQRLATLRARFEDAPVASFPEQNLTLTRIVKAR